jgi:hypothetical protein
MKSAAAGDFGGVMHAEFSRILMDPYAKPIGSGGAIV